LTSSLTHHSDNDVAISTATTIRNFALVGAVGFTIEALLLTILMRWTDLEAWQARLPSFLTAVFATWALNRIHTFRGRGLQRRSLDALAYASIQTCGAAINLGIFALCLFYFPRLRTAPIVPLGIGAIGGFCFNFLASNALLYTRRQRHSES
jgi:putative flippase GtrA